MLECFRVAIVVEISKCELTVGLANILIGLDEVEVDPLLRGGVAYSIPCEHQTLTSRWRRREESIH